MEARKATIWFVLNEFDFSVGTENEKEYSEVGALNHAARKDGTCWKFNALRKQACNKISAMRALSVPYTRKECGIL